MKKSLSMLLITFSLSACSTVEVIHAPVGCLGQPTATLNFTKLEFDAMTNGSKKKLVVFAKTLRARIYAQCKVNHNHDKLHEGVK